MVVLCLGASQAQASMVLNDGDTHNISHFVSGRLFVFDNVAPPPTTTTVNLLTGGSVAMSLKAVDSSLVNINSGSIGDDLTAIHSSTANIYGVGFNYPYGPITATSGTLTGTLYMGDPLSVDFWRYDFGTINLIERAVIPAPGALVLGAIGLSCAGWRLRRRSVQTDITYTMRESTGQ